MECNIEYVGKLRNGTKQYYCTVHKAFASDKKGNKLQECLCEYKDAYNHRLNIKVSNIKDIKVTYENVLENTIPQIIIDNQDFNGILEYDDWILSYKDLGGIMLSKLNNIPLQVVKCSHCGHYHSDNGKFAYTPHRTHLCLYCGHLFRVKEKNIGNELDIIYDIPQIKLKEGLIKIDDKCCVEFDLFKGLLFINKQEGNKILLKNKEMGIIEFLNHILENEF